MKPPIDWNLVLNMSTRLLMKSAGFVWTDDRLHAYLPAPARMLPGIKMTYGGLKNPAQLDDLIAFLNSQR